jgi:hypothetical protein
MRNIFSDLVAKLTRRQKKNKPVPVKPKEPEEKPIKAVTYNRADGVVSGAQLKGGVIWDDIAKVYMQESSKVSPKATHRGTNYVIQAQNTDRVLRERKIKNPYHDDHDFEMYVAGTAFDEAWVYQNEESAPQIDSKPLDSPSGYDYPRETFSPAYEAPSPSYEAPASTTTYDSGSSWSTPSDSGSSSSYSGGSSTDSGSYSSSDSGGW